MPPAPLGRSVPGVTGSDIDFARLVFVHIVGAERAYGDVAGQGQAWAREVTFVGLLSGPLGLPVGFVGGGITGGLSEEHIGPQLRSALFDELRRLGARQSHGTSRN
jgi:hypothetical protein